MTMLKRMLIVLSALLGFGHATLPTDDFPQAALSNGQVQTTLYLPDASRGYYRGTRFDWAGSFKDLTYKGHSFIVPWFENYDPKLHDAISGPAEEFTPVGYVEAKPGDTFIKIGVGVLRKPDEKPYAFATYYDIINPGQRSVKTAKEHVTFTQVLTDTATGYGYRYVKTVRLSANKPELVLEHSLKNTGKRPIETSTYNHNFFIIDKQPTGPTVNVQFPFPVTGEGKGFGSLIRTENNRLVYSREFEKKENVFSTGLQGFGATSADYDIRIENRKTGAGLRIRGDKPLQKLVYWACATTSCPEPYVHVPVAPGQEVRWTIRYEFYEKPAP